MEYLSLGRVIDSFGLDGTVKIASSTYFAVDRYVEGYKIDLVKNGNRETLTVEHFRHQKDTDFVKFKEINSKEEALERKGSLVEIIKDDSVLEKGEYFFSDLEKCEVYDSNNCRLGKVKRVEEFPSVITLRVGRDNKGDFFVPFIKEFIKEVDINNKRIIINVMEGML